MSSVEDLVFSKEYEEACAASDLVRFASQFSYCLTRSYVLVNLTSFVSCLYRGTLA